jgi:hypothetical protein
MPEAVAGIVGAALALGAEKGELFQGAEPLGSDQDMLAAAGELAGTAWEVLRAATDLAAEAQAALDAARQDQRAAARREGGQETAQARDDAVAAARQAADSECALEAAESLTPRVKFALRRLEGVPDDLRVTYEIPYDHVESGRTLPFSGDFITPEAAEGALT